MSLLSILLVSSIGGVGVHVQSDCGDGSSDDAQSLCRSWLGGQLSANLLFRIHEVGMDLPQYLWPASPPYHHVQDILMVDTPHIGFITYYQN